MKKTSWVFALILLLSLSLCPPAAAVTEYGVIYDETESLGSQTLGMQGEETLPQLTEALGIDLRVDVLTLIDDDNIGDAAAWLYEEYGYGYGADREGVTLTILMEPLDVETYTYAMPTHNGWYVYANLSEARGSSQELADAVSDAVAPYMVERAWNGEDMTMSATALTQAVDAMAVAAEDYILTHCPPGTSGEETGTETAEPSKPPQAPQPSTFPESPEIPETPGQNSVKMQYVFDLSDLLSYEEWEKLETRAQDISRRHNCGVYFALVDDYTDYGDGSVYEVTWQLYHGSELGMGEKRDGIIVLLSMAERDYAMFVYGENAEYAFNEYGQEQLEEAFLDDFGDDDWYGGISHYLDTCDAYLTQAETGKPVRPASWPKILMATGISCAVAGAVCFLLMRSMKSVRQKAEADTYLTQGGLQLTEQYDRYTHTTETRTKIEKNDSGSSSESGGGGSGRSGKF